MTPRTHAAVACGLLLALVTTAPVADGANNGLRPLSAFPRERIAIETRSARRHVFDAWRADTLETRAQGLMFVDGLRPGQAMIFVYPSPQRVSMWMKNTLIPLDMIWLDTDRRVVSIAHSVPPCKADPCPSFSPTADALYVVEVVSGFAKRHKVREGDVLTFKGMPGGKPGR